MPKAPPVIPVAKKEPFKQEIKKNDTVKPKPAPTTVVTEPKKEEKKQQTLFGVGSGGFNKQTEKPPVKPVEVPMEVVETPKIVVVETPLPAEVPKAVVVEDVKMKSAEKSPPRSKLEASPV